MSSSTSAAVVALTLVALITIGVIGTLFEREIAAWWRKNLGYARYVYRHKVAVYRAGRMLGVGRWRLLTHDLSKLRRDEWAAYAQSFYGGPFPAWADVSCYAKQNHAEHAWAHSKEGVREAFNHAWRHHQQRNPHHWQHHLCTMDQGNTIALRMPYDCWREMIADWCGAGVAIKGHPIESALRETRVWYAENKGKMILHEDTRRNVEMTLVCEGD